MDRFSVIDHSSELRGIRPNVVTTPGLNDVFSLQVATVDAPQAGGEAAYEHPAIVLPLVKTGNVFYRHLSTQRLQIFQPGQLGIFPQGFSHICQPELGSQFCELVIRKNFLRQRVDALGIHPMGGKDLELSPTLAFDDTRLKHLIAALIPEVRNPLTMDRIYVESMLDWIILRLLDFSPLDTRWRRAVSRLNTAGLDRALQYAHDNLSNPHWGLDDWARAAGYSTFHLVRLFNRAVGYAPYQYLLRQRVSLAKNLLAGSDLTILQLCLKSGFNNAAHFSTVFRRYTGYSPSSYRAMTQYR